MFLMWLFNLAMDNLNSFFTLVSTHFIEINMIPGFVADFLFDAVELALFFIPVTVYPIFIIVPSIWAYRVLVAVVSEFFSTVKKIPIIAKILYG